MNYGALAKTAKALIKEFGKSVTLSSASGGIYDPTTGSTTGSGQPVQTTGVAVEVDFEKSLMEEGIVTTGMKRLFAAGIQAPVPGSDTLIFEGRGWLIMKSNPLSPGGTVLLFDLVVK